MKLCNGMLVPGTLHEVHLSRGRHCNLYTELKTLRTSFLLKLTLTNYRFRNHPSRQCCPQSQKNENNRPTVQPNNLDGVDDKGKKGSNDPSPKTLDGRDDKRKTNLNDGKDVEGSNCAADCHVEVVSWRERRILASILVEASSKRVWEVLTDYERLSEFIPNLICSEKIPCPYPGRIWLLQRGMQRMMYWNIEAHVVLDLEERPSLETCSELHFSMVDGDFKRYDGKWTLRAGPRPDTTLLHYEVNVVPKVIFPAPFVESIIKADLPKNLSAIAKRVEAQVEAARPSIEPVSFKNDHGSKVMEEANPSVSMDLPLSSFGTSCKLDRQCLVDEIHFRRLDDLLENGGVHRQVVATITVKAPLKDVWSILTAYEDLPKFVPNLTGSVVLSRGNKTVRLLQEGCKCLLYMVLHARVVLDLYEQPEQKILFKQVEGDFDSFQGSWVLKQFGSQHTVLTYTVDTKIRKDCILAESLVEEFIYEDLPSNLCAIRERVETLSTRQTWDTNNGPSEFIEGEKNAACSVVKGLDILSPHKQWTKRRSHARRLREDYKMLEAELKDFIRAHGVDGVIPKREHLRHHSRFDLEKGIRAMGGFHTIAARMKLSLSYKEKKPLGYWDDLENLRNEVSVAQKVLGCDSRVLPSRLALERSGSYCLARALEKWGGAKETARILGLKTRSELRSRKNLTKKSVEDSIMSKEPALVNSLTLPPATKAEEEKKMMRGALAEEKGEASHLGDKPIDPSICRKEASNHPSWVQEASSSSSLFPEHPECGKAPMSHASISTKELSQSSLNGAKKPTSQQAAEKKMPYKTGVPQESSKWLTLCTDSVQRDVGNESQVY